MLVGADTVQVCSPQLWKMYDIIKNSVKGLQGYLERGRMNSPTDLVGRSFPCIFHEHKRGKLKGRLEWDVVLGGRAAGMTWWFWVRTGGGGLWWRHCVVLLSTSP